MTIKDLKYSFITAILLTVGFPPFPLGFLTPVALAIFIHYVIQKSPREAFWLGYFKGVIWGALTLYWIAANTTAGAVLTILINSLHYGFIWWLFRHLYQRRAGLALWSLPVIWVGMEYLRHFSDLRFNWLTLAYTQTYYVPYVQFIEWTGFLGVSLVILLLAVLIYKAFFLKKNTIPSAVGIGLLIIIPLIIGLIRMQQLKKENYYSVRVGIVQPNVDPFEKWEPAFQDSTFKILKTSSESLASHNPRLILWPETATPFYLRQEKEYLEEVFRLVDSLNIYLITGTPDYQYFLEEKEFHTYNAAFFFSPGSGFFQTYYKMALVPTAESMPFKRHLPFLRTIDVGGGDFFPGEDFTVFQMIIPRFSGRYIDGSFQKMDQEPRGKMILGVSTIICYESVFPNLAKNFVKDGARLLTIITNDGWFGTTSGPFQHARYAVFRAIENRVSIARSANTGISFFIDPLGNTYKWTPLNTRANITEDLPIREGITFYTRHGDWLGFWSFILSFPIIGYIMIFRKKIKR